MEKDYCSKDKVSRFIFGFLIVAFVSDLLFIFFEFNDLRFISKNALMPLLLLWYFVVASKSNLILIPLLIVGLVFSFLGDFFLLFGWGFIPGLVSFLLAHIFYILCLLKFKKKSAIAFLPLIIIYLVILLYILTPHLGVMLVPVVAYGITISTMLFFSLMTNNKFLIFGALFFVISDSVLAYNLFVDQTKIFNLIVMITYVIAQFLLVKGFIKSSSEVKFKQLKM